MPGFSNNNRTSSSSSVVVMLRSRSDDKSGEERAYGVVVPLCFQLEQCYCFDVVGMRKHINGLDF